MALQADASLEKIATSLLRDIKNLGSSSGGDTQRRDKIVRAAKKIISEVAEPMDQIKDIWVTMGDIAGWNVFMHWNAFDHIPLEGSISYRNLANRVAAEEGLVARIGGMLVASGTLLEIEPGCVSHSRVSRLYRSERPSSSLAWISMSNGLRPYVFWPEYFEKYGRREPQGPSHTPCSFSWGKSEMAIWEIIASDPEYSRRLAEAMRARQLAGGNEKVAGPEALYDMAWIGEEASSWPADSMLVVDVGGGHGQLLKDLLTEIPLVPPQRCMLQDRPEVIEDARAATEPLLQEVVKMPHDFHAVQPARGALVYILRRVLLDHSDGRAVGILRHLAEAMPDSPKARVLIMEELLIEPPNPKNRIVDLVMLNMGGKLRNREMYERVLVEAGLRMVKFYTKPGSPLFAMECIRA